MSDHLTTGTRHEDGASELEVLRWRRHGDVWEALVGRELDGSLVTEWVPALPMTRKNHDETAGPVSGRSDEVDDAVAAQVRREVAHAFGRHGQYHEMVEIEDLERFALLERIAANEGKPEKPEEQFFKELKSRVVDAYYTSEIGIKQELEYRGNTYQAEFSGVDVSKE